MIKEAISTKIMINVYDTNMYTIVLVIIITNTIIISDLSPAVHTKVLVLPFTSVTELSMQIFNLSGGPPAVCRKLRHNRMQYY